MIDRIRNVTASTLVTSITLGSIVFTALWALGPFIELGGIFPLPLTNQTIDVHSGAGMMHVTVRHDIPATTWSHVYQIGVYPPSERNQHVDTYLSLRLPKSFGQETAFGRKTWVARSWSGNQPAPRYTRYWFPSVIPASVFGTILLVIFARWRFKRLTRIKDVNRDSNES